MKNHQTNFAIPQNPQTQEAFFRKSHLPKKGFALVISLILVALITIFTVSISSTIIESMRGNRNIESSLEAYYAAQGGLEMALFAQKQNNEAGFQKAMPVTASSGLKIDYKNFNGATAKWQVVGRAGCRHKVAPDVAGGDDPQTCESSSSGTYFTPRPGTGTAGADCDPLGNYSDVNHACNWNKIAYGESVAIPLYMAYDPNNDADNFYENLDGTDGTTPDGILNPAELGMTELKVKVRTPCKDPQGANECDASNRYMLDLGEYNDPFTSPTIMIWEITGECEDGSGKVVDCYLQQVDDKDLVFDSKDILKNSEIYAALINNYTSLSYRDVQNEYRVLYQEDFGVDNFLFQGTLLDFLKNEKTSLNDADVYDENKNVWNWDYSTSGRTLHRPMLSLQVIQSLREEISGSSELGQQIPYLEFQVEMEGDAEIADIYQTFISEGFSDNFKQSLEAKRGHQTGALKFVIQN